MKKMIIDFKAGTKVLQPVLVKVNKIGNSSNGGVFARGMVEDNSGRIPFICFDAAIVDKLRDVEGTVAMMMGGDVDLNKFATDNSQQVVIKRLDELLPQDDISTIVPNGEFDHELYEQKLQMYIKSVKTPVLRALLDKIFSGEIYEQFVKNPAGMRMHHAYLGGLLQHSVDVCGLAVAMASQIEGVDKDLIITGALLHDLGKIREISSGMGFPYLTEGRLMGHIAITSLMVQQFAMELHIPAARLQHLHHILLSHHGDNEKGSPIGCATREALIVHYADEMNAIMNQFEPGPNKKTGGWENNRMVGHYICLDKI